MTRRKVEAVSLRDLSDIRVSYQLVTLNDYNEILIVTYEGEYRTGSAGNPDAAYMRGMAVAAIEAFSPDAVVFDLAKLRYLWGDMLESVYSTAPEALDEEKARFAVVVGSECREAVRTLELGELSTEPLSAIPWAHETIEAACDYLEKNVL